jgi:lysyl-tRNA synthetase class 2
MNQDNIQSNNILSTENHIVKERLSKLDSYKQKGFNYPNQMSNTHTADLLQNSYSEHTKIELEEAQIPVTISGRIMGKRRSGKLMFLDLASNCDRIQIFISKGDVGEDVYADIRTWDVGDIATFTGVLFRTMKGELSVQTKHVILLNKTLRPLPEKFHGLKDTETCYRQRYLDLIMHKETRERFKMRSKIIKFIRNYLDEEDFLEVDTNILQSIPSGATAKKFMTHMDSLNLDLNLRVAPELPLKRLVVGGFERVYEIGKNFRNEGLSTRHNPEFTMVEFYQAYTDYHGLMDKTESMLQGIAQMASGSDIVSYGDYEIDFSNFTRMTVLEAIIKYQPKINIEDLNQIETAIEVAKSFNIDINKNWGLGRIQMEIFEEVAEEQLIQPTFITEYPVEVSPLARVNDDNSHVTDRFELFIAGRELANGFSELNDPLDQHTRFLEQIKEKDLGDDEAMPYDADYIQALEYGLPPTAGEGIGVDRLVMLFTNSHSIKDVMLFPQLKPEQ